MDHTVTRGLVHILRGDGAGKTTAAVGLCVRFNGAGGTAIFAQFLKTGDSSELEPLRTLGVEVYSPGGPSKFLFQMSAAEKEKYRCLQQSLWETVKTATAVKRPGLLVLDEVLDAVSTGMLSADDLTTFLKERPSETELVLTGHVPLPEIEEMADYISEVRAVRHPYDRGISARKGIEY